MLLGMFACYAFDFFYYLISIYKAIYNMCKRNPLLKIWDWESIRVFDILSKGKAQKSHHAAKQGPEGKSVKWKLLRSFVFFILFF